MKKIISLLLVAVMCLSFASCSAFDGRNKVRKQAETAPFLSYDNYCEAYEENQVRAKDEYEGKVYKFSGGIDKVTERYCLVSIGAYDSVIKVYLEKEDVLKLNSGEPHGFVGVLDIDMFGDLSLKDAILFDDLLLNEDDS